MCTQGVSLHVLLPACPSVLLPNLRQAQLAHCTLTPAARTTLVDAGCRRLRRLEIKALSAQPAPGAPSLQLLATAQLRQLAKLPSVSSIALMDSSCPTHFLAALGTQLTHVSLHDSYRQCEPGTQTPTPGWRATLQHVARCTRLQELIIPCGTAEELALVAPALQQLRELTISALEVQADGDALVEALLGLPHLTSLTWEDISWLRLRRWHNDRPCRWEQVVVSDVSLSPLARLPLHSLQQPVQWRCLEVPVDAPIQEVRAAAANVTRRCPAGFCWEGDCPRLWLRAEAGGTSSDVRERERPLALGEQPGTISTKGRR